MVTVERAAAYYILGRAAVGALAVLFVLFLTSPNLFIFGLAGLGALALGYCWWFYWR